MGKAALIALSAFILASTYYSISTRDGQADAVRATSKHQLTILARNAAVTGYDQAKQALADEGTLEPFVSGETTIEGDYDGAEYTATITSDGTVANIESIATSGNGVDEVAYTVKATIGLETGASSNTVPPFLTYALLSEESLQLNGNVGGYVADPDQPLNANFHTNANLHINGNAANVAGFGSYTGSATANPWKALSNTFQPNHNPDDLETAFQTPAVEIPTFDAEEFLEGSDVDQTSNGDVILSGSLNLGGTKENPYVWHVRGNLTASGGSTVDGYVMFVVDGSINLNGNLAAGGATDESSVALYAGGDVTLNGNIQVHGQIYTEGDVILNGTPDVYGSIASHSGVTMNGNPGIHYRPASPALSSIFSEGDPALTLLSYFEH